ncbi:MAG TPA: hypothetical protein C5S37_14110, partial [Methanophagales archaeon]|nr:hypothetical protein [Methanophagales archaeon]HJH27860.1 hypothetical protein [Methanophagales archaeon]
MSYIRKIIRRNKSGKIKVYYAEVESVRVGRKVIQRHIRSLGTNPSAPTNFPIDDVQFSYLAIRLMQGDLTPNEVFDMLEGMGHPVTRDSLERIGINYDFGKKNVLYLPILSEELKKIHNRCPICKKKTLRPKNRQKNSQNIVRRDTL